VSYDGSWWATRVTANLVGEQPDELTGVREAGWTSMMSLLFPEREDGGCCVVARTSNQLWLGCTAWRQTNEPRAISIHDSLDRSPCIFRLAGHPHIASIGNELAYLTRETAANGALSACDIADKHSASSPGRRDLPCSKIHWEKQATHPCPSRRSQYKGQTGTAGIAGHRLLRRCSVHCGAQHVRPVQLRTPYARRFAPSITNEKERYWRTPHAR
jgi:hypothetical protein